MADELVQETFLSIWRKAALFDPGKATASTWIYTIARNLRIDALRRMRRPEFDPTDPALAPAPEAAPDSALDAIQTQARIQRAFAELPPQQLEVIQLAFLADKSHREIAKHLSLPLGTVKSRLRLALQRMRVILEDEGE